MGGGMPDAGLREFGARLTEVRLLEAGLGAWRAWSSLT